MSDEQNERETWREPLEALVALLFGLPGLALFVLSLWFFWALGDDCEWGRESMLGGMSLLAAIAGAVLFLIGEVVGVRAYRRWRSERSAKK